MSRYYAETPCPECGQPWVLRGHGSHYHMWQGERCYGPGPSRTELRMAALTKAFDDAAAEDGVQWNPNLGPILKRARELSENT